MTDPVGLPQLKMMVIVIVPYLFRDKTDPEGKAFHGVEKETRIAAKDPRSTSTAIGIDYVDIKVDASAKAPLRLTLLWLKDKRWEHIDYMVAVGRHA